MLLTSILRPRPVRNDGFVAGLFWIVDQEVRLHPDVRLGQFRCTFTRCQRGQRWQDQVDAEVVCGVNYGSQILYEDINIEFFSSKLI